MPFLLTPVSFEVLARGFSLDLGYESRHQLTMVPRLPDGVNSVTLWSIVLSHCQL